MAYEQSKESSEAGDEYPLLPTSDLSKQSDSRRPKKDTSRRLIIGCMILLLVFLSVTNATTAIYLTRAMQDQWHQTYSRTCGTLHHSKRRLLRQTSFSRIDRRVLDNIPNHDGIQLSRPSHRRRSVAAIRHQWLCYAPQLLGRRPSLACCKINARKSLPRDLRCRRFPSVALPRMNFPSSHHLRYPLIVSYMTFRPSDMKSSSSRCPSATPSPLSLTAVMSTTAHIRCGI